MSQFTRIRRYFSTTNLRRTSAEEQQEVQKETQELLMELYEIEMAYTEEIYTSIGLVEDVNRLFVTMRIKGL